MPRPWLWPLPGKKTRRVPRARGSPNRFGARRRFDVHTGVDLFRRRGAPVVACEGGVVVRVERFTGPRAGSPWWRETWAVLVEGRSGVILYGEIRPDPSIRVGRRVKRGSPVGTVLTVLTKNKGRPMTMLHLELYRSGTRRSTWWRLRRPKPRRLLDPTPRLLAAALAP